MDSGGRWTFATKGNLRFPMLVLLHHGLLNSLVPFYSCLEMLGTRSTVMAKPAYSRSVICTHIPSRYLDFRWLVPLAVLKEVLCKSHQHPYGVFRRTFVARCTCICSYYYTANPTHYNTTNPNDPAQKPV